MYTQIGILCRMQHRYEFFQHPEVMGRMDELDLTAVQDITKNVQYVGGADTLIDIQFAENGRLSNSVKPALLKPEAAHVATGNNTMSPNGGKMYIGCNSKQRLVGFKGRSTVCNI